MLSISGRCPIVPGPPSPPPPGRRSGTELPGRPGRGAAWPGGGVRAAGNPTVLGTGGRGGCCSWPGSAWAVASAPCRTQPWGHQCRSPSPQPLLGPAGSWPRVPGDPGDPGALAPAPAGTASPSAPGGACGPPRRVRAQVTRGSTGSASSRAVPLARCRSVPCSAPSMTTNPSWAHQPGTAGCPSTEVSPRVAGGITGLMGAMAVTGVTPFPSRPAPAAPNVCDLNCLAVGHNFYYSFGRVLDGTRCGPGSPDLCVSGRCLSVGCDGILGSGARPDACGQCGGGHDACLFVHRLFQGAEPSSGYFGYMNVTKIPAGATHIKVTDKSRNYLALMMSDGRYVLNGDWSIAWPGPLEVAGTRLRYTRAPDGTESLEAPGPTAEDLHLMVLLQEPNPSIEYEFWLPRGPPQPGRGDTSPLRQPQPRGAGSPPPPEPPVTPVPAPPPQPRGFVTEPPPRNTPSQSGARAATGRCGRCHLPKGRSQRIRHFCQSDFVFQGRILAQDVVGQETRYEVEVTTSYRHHFPLVSREYVWVPNTCGCPPLRVGTRYLLMARRHVNYERTLNRLLLQDDGYARPWTPREERLVRGAARHCPPRPP